MTNPLLIQDSAANGDELSDIITRIEDATEDVQDGKLIIALITLAIYRQSSEMEMQELADVAFDVSKYIVARLVGRSPTEMN